MIGYRRGSSKHVCRFAGKVEDGISIRFEMLELRLCCSEERYRSIGKNGEHEIWTTTSETWRFKVDLEAIDQADCSTLILYGQLGSAG